MGVAATASLLRFMAERNEQFSSSFFFLQQVRHHGMEDGG